MVGPKLDARSYTTLLLTVVAVLLAMNLVTAQSGESQKFQTEALAIADLAKATREVAAANSRIATAIDGLATAVGKVKLEVKTGDSAPAASSSTSTDDSGSAPSSGGDVIFDLN